MIVSSDWQLAKNCFTFILKNKVMHLQKSYCLQNLDLTL